MEARARNRVFICYCRQDEQWLQALLRHLRLLEKEADIRSWSNVEIEAGSDWHKQIREALGTARVAVLLLSADFCASEFIWQEELPVLFAAAERGELSLLPVFVSPCNLPASLAGLQGINKPENTLQEMDSPARERVFMALCNAIRKILNAARVPATLEEHGSGRTQMCALGGEEDDFVAALRAAEAAGSQFHELLRSAREELRPLNAVVLSVLYVALGQEPWIPQLDMAERHRDEILIATRSEYVRETRPRAGLVPGRHPKVKRALSALERLRTTMLSADFDAYVAPSFEEREHMIARLENLEFFERFLCEGRKILL